MIRIDKYIFRGTRRHAELNVNDPLAYLYPTSWSSQFQNAYNFIEEEENPVVLSFFSSVPVKGLYNQYNSYGENEIILYPLILRVTKKDKVGKITMLEVTPI